MSKEEDKKEVVVTAENKTPKYDVIIFTYREDAHTLVPCIKSLNHTIGDELGTILVVDDGNCAMHREQREKVESLPHVKYMVSLWPRNGNLIGKSHQQNYLKLLKECVEDKTFTAKVVIKIDPDTSIWKKEWLDTFWEDDEYLFVSSFKSEGNDLYLYPMGNCYAFKLDYDIVKKAYEDSLKYPDFFNAFEDYCVTARMVRIADEFGKYKLGCFRYRSGAASSSQPAFLLVPPEHSVDHQYIKSECAVFCNGFGINKSNKHLQSEIQTAVCAYILGEKQGLLRDGFIYDPVKKTYMPKQHPPQQGMVPPPNGKTGVSVNPTSGQLINSGNSQATLKMDPSKMANMGLINNGQFKFSPDSK